MRVIKMYCDRCGKEFKNWNHKHEEKIGIADFIHEDGNSYLDMQKDLCESCYIELVKWWFYNDQDYLRRNYDNFAIKK